MEGGLDGGADGDLGDEDGFLRRVEGVVDVRDEVADPPGEAVVDGREEVKPHAQETEQGEDEQEVFEVGTAHEGDYNTGGEGQSFNRMDGMRAGGAEL
jgi:hypothetical protein